MALAREVVALFHSLLASEQGLSRSWVSGSEARESQLPRVAADQIISSNMPAALLAQQSGMRYPRFQIYCDRVENEMTEKFNKFSGTARLTVEIHHSHEKWESVTSALELYVQAVTNTIEAQRGQLADGVHLPGRYVVDVDAPKAGGRGFLQSARILIPVEITRP